MTTLLVQKFGGTSLAGPDRIKRAAQRIAAARDEGHQVVAVVSAMGSTTNRLLDLAGKLNGPETGRELDRLLSTGETASAAALALTLNSMGIPARSFSGREAGIVTDGAHGSARIVDVAPAGILEELGAGGVPVVTGFQGVSAEQDVVTTLGRGGSDTTAVALAAALHAGVCEIYTDVDGVYTADPRHVPSARKIEQLDYEAMSELASGGAKVLAHSSVEYAGLHSVPVHVRSSASGAPGTWVSDTTPPAELDGFAERFTVCGVTHAAGQQRYRLGRVSSRTAEDVLAALSGAALTPDMVHFHSDHPTGGTGSLHFTLGGAGHERVAGLLETVSGGLGQSGSLDNRPVAKVSLVGRGLSAHPALVPQALQTLRKGGVAVGGVSVHARRLSVLCPPEEALTAVGLVHLAFLEPAGLPELAA
ncbi:aspartate kinase [Streptomyces sp. URMC 127]|uniref:aspartate kinase n=1 Tax=Streptomyces sp. URMC 127 TaxID=3423402 RepID=UPI003F1BA4F3